MYKQIISTISEMKKVLCTNALIWQVIKDGMPPILQEVKDSLYLKYGSNRIYGDKTLYLQSQLYSLEPDASNINECNVKFYTSNKYVVNEYGKVHDVGVSNVRVEISLKTPDPGYTINTFSKTFEITVVR